MHVNPHKNLVDALDRGILPNWRGVEMENIRAAMRQTERRKFEKLLKIREDSR